MANKDIYFRKLVSFCKTCHIKVKNYEPKNSLMNNRFLRVTECDSETHGEFSMSKRTVYLNKNLGGLPRVAIFLHEVGHFLDELTPTKQSEINAYNKYSEGKPLTKNQKAKVYNCEVRAWDNAEKLATALKIRKGKWFYSERKKALNYCRALH